MFLGKTRNFNIIENNEENSEKYMTKIYKMNMVNHMFHNNIPMSQLAPTHILEKSLAQNRFFQIL